MQKLTAAFTQTQTETQSAAAGPVEHEQVSEASSCAGKCYCKACKQQTGEKDAWPSLQVLEE